MRQVRITELQANHRGNLDDYPIPVKSIKQAVEYMIACGYTVSPCGPVPETATSWDGMVTPPGKTRIFVRLYVRDF